MALEVILPLVSMTPVINSVSSVNSIRNSRNKINTKSFVKEQYLDGICHNILASFAGRI
jgi:hypothetical protein